MQNLCYINTKVANSIKKMIVYVGIVPTRTQEIVNTISFFVGVALSLTIHLSLRLYRFCSLFVVRYNKNNLTILKV